MWTIKSLGMRRTMRLGVLLGGTLLLTGCHYYHGGHGGYHYGPGPGYGYYKHHRGQPRYRGGYYGRGHGRHHRRYRGYGDD